MITPPLSSAPTLEWAQFYIDHRGAPIPVPFKSKKPVLDEWPDLRVTRETAPAYFNGAPSNVGMLLGAASGGLTDIDLDCPDAVVLAARFLPPTACRFGRTSTGVTHWAYRIAPSMPTTKFTDVEKGADGERAMLVEFRGDGAQTLFPPSVHPLGERIEFVGGDFAPAEVDGADLLRRARLLAIACFLARHWPPLGSRHEAALGASGLLLRAGVPVEDVMLVVTSAAREGKDDEGRRAEVLSTYDTLNEGGAVLGGPALTKVLTGDGAGVVKQIKHWLGLHLSAESQWRPPGDRPQIDVGNLGLAEMGDAAWRAIEGANEPPRIYRYGSTLAWLAQDPAGQPQVELMGQEHMSHHLAQVAVFLRRTPRLTPAFPPERLSTDLLAVPRGTLPRLVRLVRAPVFAADGRLLTAQGYDAASGLYVAMPAGLVIPPISEAPTATELDQARTCLVDELLVDFPFSGIADRAHALALLLTPLLRECITGDVPLFVLSKSTPRTGATLLVKAVSIVQDGVPTSPTTISADEEENRKKFTAILLSSPPMALLDNVHGRLGSAALAAILTSGGTWTDRLLGKTQQVTVPVRAVFVATGNNPALSNEMAGRSVLIRLDAKMEDPSTRTGFRHPQLEAWVREHRGRLLGAALTLGQGWVAAGRPLATHLTFGGFQEWAGVLGGVLDMAGVPGFLGNRRDLFEQADEENASIRAFLADWLAKYGTENSVTTKELLDVAKNHPLDIAAKSDHGLLVRLGRLIGGLVDRWYAVTDDGTVAVKRLDGRAGVVAWRLVERVDGGVGGTGGCAPRHMTRESNSITAVAGVGEVTGDIPPTPSIPTTQLLLSEGRA